MLLLRRRSSSLAFVALLIAACGGDIDQATRLTSTPTPKEEGPATTETTTPPSTPPPPAPAPSETELALVAGGLGGYGSADDRAANARFAQPQGVIDDGLGNAIIADTDNHTIRKLVIATGEVTTIAGAAGQRGNKDGIGSDAHFASPTSLASDGKGNLFITDDSAVRRLVLATGSVTTVAGVGGARGNVDAVGSAARFNFPTGIAFGVVDGADVVFVADSGSNSIRQVDIATQSVTTFSAAAFDHPRGVAHDGAGHLFVADSMNHLIWKVDIATKVAIPLAGAKGESGSVDDTAGVAGAARFNYPTGISADAAGNLFVADSSNHAVRKIVVATGVVTTFVGASGECGHTDGSTAVARLCGPYGGVASLGTDGSMLITDTLNHTIRTVSAAGVVATPAGNAPHRGSIDDIGGAARFRNPYSVASDARGDLLIADLENHTIRKVIAASGTVTTFAGVAGKFGATDSASGEARFYNPSAVATDDAGNVFVSDAGNHTIRKVDAAGVVTTLAGVAGKAGRTNTSDGEARFYAPAGLTSDGAGGVFVADCGNNSLRKIVVASGVVTTVASGFSCPWGLVSDRAGHLFVADNANNAIRRVDVASGAVTTVAGGGTRGYSDGVGGAAQFNNPRGLSIDIAQGNLLVADYGNHAIRKVSLASNTVSTFVGQAGVTGVKPGPLSARLSFPMAVAVAVTPTTASQTFVLDENSLLVVR